MEQIQPSFNHSNAFDKCPTYQHSIASHNIPSVFFSSPSKLQNDASKEKSQTEDNLEFQCLDYNSKENISFREGKNGESQKLLEAQIQINQNSKGSQDQNAKSMIFEQEIEQKMIQIDMNAEKESTNKFPLRIQQWEEEEEEILEERQVDIQFNMREENLRAQVPYPSRIKHSKPCCELPIRDISDYCKNFKFLNSCDRNTELQALKFFETRIKTAEPQTLMKLVSHGFLDTLLSKLNQEKVDEKTSLSLKVLFQLCKLKSSIFKHQTQNLFYEKLLEIGFCQIISKYGNLLDKRCCLFNQVKEMKQCLCSYKFEQQRHNNKSNVTNKQNDCPFISQNEKQQEDLTKYPAQQLVSSKEPISQQYQQDTNQLLNQQEQIQQQNQNQPQQQQQGASRQRQCFFRSLFC